MAQRVSPTTHLTFFHRYNTEGNADGGVLEVSTDAGATWVDVLDAGGVFVAGAYNSPLASGSGFALSGRDAWNGLSASFPSAMDPVDVNLAALAGETIKVRFRWCLDLDLRRDLDLAVRPAFDAYRAVRRTDDGKGSASAEFKAVVFVGRSLDQGW